ncbi:MAG: hypothetical protein PWR04_427 [Anaerophaga sp.]|nr:hypothetical protein [Anaerophaga sp.]
MDESKPDTPLVSVWMITYNHERYIAQAIEGVLMQKTNFKIELVIGEDCSTDNTAQIIKEYEKKYPQIIKPRFNQTNLGVIPNMIKTLNECTGKYIALCEGDDYWTDPYKLQKQVDFLEDNREYSICFHNVKIKKNGELIDDYITRDVPETTDIYELAKGNFMHTPSVTFRRNWEKLPDWITKCSAGDYPLHMINAQYGKIKKFEDTMGVYRIHDSNMWVNQNGGNMSLNIHNYLDAMIGNFPEEVEKILIQRYFKITTAIINTFWQNGEKEKANIYFNRIVDKAPIETLEQFLKANTPKSAKYHLKELKRKLENKLKSCL